MLLAEKGVRGKGRQPLSPPQLTLTRKLEQRFRLKTNFRVDDNPFPIASLTSAVSLIQMEQVSSDYVTVRCERMRQP
jgi:hypothetical protein